MLGHLSSPQAEILKANHVYHSQTTKYKILQETQSQYKGQTDFKEAKITRKKVKQKQESL